MAWAGHKSFSCQHGHVPCFINWSARSNKSNLMPDCVTRQEMIKAKFSKGQNQNASAHAFFKLFPRPTLPGSNHETILLGNPNGLSRCLNQEGNGSRVARGLRSRRELRK